MNTLWYLLLTSMPVLPHSRSVPTAALELVLVAGGTFLMGDLFSEGEEDERPVHRVTIGDFLLSPYEVTVAEFAASVTETDYVTSAEAPLIRRR